MQALNILSGNNFHKKDFHIAKPNFNLFKYAITYNLIYLQLFSLQYLLQF